MSKRSKKQGSTTTPSHSVGERLRELRKQRKLTLEALSEKSGISISSLSRIENTRLSLNVEKIHTLAEALDVAAEVFLGSKLSTTLPVKPVGEPRLSIDRHRSRDSIREAELSQQFLFPDIHDSKLDCIVFEIDPVSIWESEFVSHPGEKVLYVIEGDLLIYIQGRSPVLLESGDSLFMDGHIWHSTVAANSKPARVFTVYSPNGLPPTAAGANSGDFESRRFTADEWSELNA
ncbi:helix-turn-helix domain-containing protein [Luminiphilus syltensis]|uniref:helix-turn-helix domain-containing protein n=1 Tax=Luminiphilus syltensis TaxID=1341119 RepID=UPI00030CAF6E|nr:XRE family transcriptional regulator [Luminiphilus syltensis]